MKPWICDTTGHQADPELCRVKHLAAVVRKRREKEQGIPAGFSPCLFCPEYLEHRDEEESKVPDIYKVGTCAKCGAAGVKVFKKSEICARCNGKQAAKTAGRGRAETPAQGPATEPTAPIRAGLTITIDLGRIPDLFATLAAKAEMELRTPEDQALWLVKTGVGL